MNDPNTAVPMTPEDYRRRYFELKARATEAGARPVKGRDARNPKALPRDLVLLEETIPGGWYWIGHVARGLSLRIVNDKASDGISALFWNAKDTSERLNPADSVKVQWTSRLSRGKLLLSDMGRALASITDDTCGYHDFVAGGSTRLDDEKKFGADPTRRNTRDNFVLAAAKHGMTVRDVGPCVSFFAPAVTDDRGKLIWREGAAKPGDYIDLRAEMDLIIALSNCPHPLSPKKTWAAGPVRAIVWNSPAVGSDDYCRNASDEAARAFDNTDAYNRE
ncbi:MAG: urea amidolyase associated protein UAAP1 [Alphaproteobacteria bacterium]